MMNFGFLKFVGTCCFIMHTCFAGAQFTSEFNPPSGTFLEDVVYADENTVMVTGSNLYRTSIDDARNWIGLSSGGMFVKAADFSSIHFGIAVGNAGLYRTNNQCGYFWGWSSNKYIGVTKDLLDVHFIDDNNGVVCGNDGTLRITSNQGTTWTAVTSGTTNHIKGVYSINDSVFFACANGGLVLKVQNGVVIQSTVLNASLDFNKVFFTTNLEGYIIGTLGTIYKTTDAGTTWNLLTSGTTENLLGIEFTNVNHGVVTGTNGKLFYTNNAGLTWTPAVSAATGEVRSVAFKNDTTGYAVGSNFVLHTSNGGLNWTRVDGTMQKVHFPTPEIGYCAGYFGVAFKTTDGGNNWKPMHLNTIQYLNDIYFINKDTGYAVGGAEIHRTLDGGETWSLIPNPSTSSLYAVHFTDYNHGVATGYRRTVLYTNNGGATWTHTYNSSATVYYLDVTFTTPLNGYFCSSAGEIYRTTNGGVSWTVMGAGSSLNSIFFSDVNNGWIVGGNGTIKHTTNGGSTYVTQTSGVTTWLHGVHFFDNNRGVVVGSAGTYLITYNGGNTWINKSSGSLDYTDVYFTDSLHGHATSGISVYGIAPFTNYGTTYPYCPGDGFGFNSFDPYHITNSPTNVVFEIAPVNSDYSSGIILDATVIDSIGNISTTLPDTLSPGLYKTRVRDMSDPTNVSIEKYITMRAKPVVTIEIQGSNLVATADQTVTFAWYYRASTSFVYVGSGAVLPISGEGDYYVFANSGCCDTQTEWQTVVLCGSSYVFASYSNTQTICQGESIVVGSNTYTVSGTYTDSLTNSSGCDSIITTTLTVKSTASSNQNPVLCYGETFTVGSSVYNVDGTYVDTLVSVTGCDSLVYTNLVILPESSSLSIQTLCHGDSLNFNGNYYNASGTFADTLTSSSGCDSIASLQLTILDLDTATTFYNICQGQSITVGSNTYTTSGNYTDVFTNSTGCDSIVYSSLNVNTLPPVSLGNDTLMCENDSVVLDAGSGMSAYVWSTGETGTFITVTDSGTYSVQITDGLGCTNSDTIWIDYDFCLSAGSLPSVDFRIYPNPVGEQLFISYPKTFDYTLHDVSGKVVLKGSGKKLAALDVSGFENGVYLLKVITAGEAERQEKVIVHH